jgi:hypothetical protein
MLSYWTTIDNTKYHMNLPYWTTIVDASLFSSFWGSVFVSQSHAWHQAILR